MQPPTDPSTPSRPASRNRPGKSRGNAVVPFVPIVLAFVVACAAKQYGDAHPDSHASMAGMKSEGGALDVNAHAPDFTLENVHGGAVTLSKVTADKPVLLVFYLGYSCPRCVRHLNELSVRSDEFRKLGAEIIAISPDTVAEERDSINTYGDFKFPMLSDPEMKVARQYGLVYGQDTLFHGVYIIDRHGVVRFAMKSSHPYDNVDALVACMKDVTAE